MLLINNEIDLGKGFDKFKADILESERMVHSASTVYSYMAAYLNLRVAATSLVYKCTGEVVDFGNIRAADPNDIKDINI